MKQTILIIMVLVALVLAGCSTQTNNNVVETQNSKLSVVTTLFPLYEFAKEVGGENIDVTLLLPPGAEPHSFEPKPSDIKKIENADAFIYVGEIMEPWAHDILEGSNNKDIQIIDASSLVTLYESNHDHDEGHSFEWAGLFELDVGEYSWTFAKVDGEYADPAMKMVILETDDSDTHGIEHVEEKAEELLESSNLETKSSGSALVPRDMVYQLKFEEDVEVSSFAIKIEKKGYYVFFTEHMPFEFEVDEHFFKDANKINLEPLAEEPETGHDHSHEHDEEHHEEEHTEHDHHHGTHDPHIWLDLENDQKIVQEIAKVFSLLDSENSNTYVTNADSYVVKLQALDQRYMSELSSCNQDEFLVGGHNFFGYIEHRYDLEGISAIENLEPNTEPTPKRIKEITDIAKEHDIKYILTEVLVSKQMAEAIATESGAQVLTFNPAPNLPKSDFDNGVTFISVMEDNLETLKTALECN